MPLPPDPSNPYRGPSDELLLRRSVVVFVDVLGFRQMVANAGAGPRAAELLTEISEALHVSREHLYDSPIFQREQRLFQIRTFTDNIVIGWPIRSDGESELGGTFMKLAMFQLEMANRGFFIRGGIDVGDVYIDDHIVFGEGLVAAYNAESQLARDPRIVLTSRARSSIESHLQYYMDPASAPQARDLYQAADGQYFLNYLDSVLMGEDIDGPYYDLVEQHRDAIQEQLARHRSSPAIWSKYAWSARYHNYFCDQHSCFEEEHRVSEDLLQISPQRIVAPSSSR